MASVTRFVRSLSERPRLTWILIAIAAIAFVGEGVYAVFWRTNDYSVHLIYGLAFLRGDPFDLDGPAAFYPVGRLWMNASLASFDYHVSRALCYVGAVLSLGLSLRMWSELARRAVPLPDAKRTAAIGWTIAVLLPFIIRDLDECGLQLLLLFFLTAAGYAFAHGREHLSAFWLATAIVYKVTPAVFLPLLVWKRQWRTAVWTVVFTLVWSMLPMTYLGVHETVGAHLIWKWRMGLILENQEAYPSVPGIEPPKPQNVSLRALIARYLETHSPGHPLFVDHPAFFQFGSLSPRAAKLAVQGIILLLGAAIALRMRRRWVRPIDNADFAPEWAVACLFAALMSPLCWRQHLVMAIPCAYLVARERLSRPDVTAWRKLLPIAAACAILLLRREIIGRDLAHVLLTYKLDTLAVLSYALLSLTLPAAVVGASAGSLVDARSATKAA